MVELPVGYCPEELSTEELARPDIVDEMYGAEVLLEISPETLELRKRLPVPVAEDTVAFVDANGAEFEPELPTEGETPPETLERSVVKTPALLDDALEPVESGTEAGDVPTMPPELDDEPVGKGGEVELEAVDPPEV